MSDTNAEVGNIEPMLPEAMEVEKPAENNSKKSEKTDESENKSSSSKKRSSTADDRHGGHRGSRSKRSKKESLSDNKPSSTRRIYIANIPYDATWQDIKDLIRDKIKDCEYVHLFEEDGKARGCGLVEFKDPNSAKKAIELFDKYDFKGRKLVVKEDFDSHRDSTGRIIKDPPGRDRSSSNSRGNGRSLDGDSYGGSSRHGNQRYNEGSNRNMGNSSDNSSVNKWGNTYGLSPQFLDSLGINNPLTNRVFVANLDYKVSVKKLREIFKLAGRVQNINLNTDKDGNSKGHGIITFEHPVEAVQAVSMFHTQLLLDRPMTVKIDRITEHEEAAAFAAKLPKGLKSIGMGLGAGGMPLTNVAGALCDKRDVMAPTGGWGGPGCNELGMNNAGLASRGNNMGGGFSDRTNISDMRGGSMGGGFSDRGIMGAGGFSDRMAGMGTGSGDRSSGMGNSFSDRAGILGNYVERKSSIDPLFDRGDFGVQNFQDRGMSGNGANTGSFADRGSSLTSPGFQDRAFNSGVGSYAERGSSNLRAGNVAGAGILGAGSSDNTRFDDYRRDYPRAVSNYGTTSTTAQDSEYRSYSTEEQTQTRYTGPVSSTVIIRNLPVQYSKLDLMDRFLEAGKIEFTKVSGDGLGLVCYASEREAQRAINIFDGSRLDGRVLEVAFR